MVFRKVGTAPIALESVSWEDGRLLPGTGADKVLYYVTDHLGSVRVVKDGTGAIRQKIDYYPYGSVSWSEPSLSNTVIGRYRFSGKESVLNDYLDFGARTYSPNTVSWLTQDPMAEGYYCISPYVYCAGNPILYFDLDGRRIIITGSSGFQVVYSPFMKIDTNDPFVENVINLLNIVYDNGGRPVIDSLSDELYEYAIVNEVGKGGNFQFKPSVAGGGTVLAGAIMSSIYDYPLGVESLSHELFHAVQYIEGQGGGDIFNEVEAYAYGYMIYNSFVEKAFSNPDFCGILPTSIAGDGNDKSMRYNYMRAFEGIVNNRFSIPFYMIMATASFKEGARVNGSHLYKHFKNTQKYKRSILMKYYPQ